MLIALSKFRDPYNNLALEELILNDESITDDVILFYVNSNAIIIGRNQNAHQEINAKYVSEKNIDVIRRSSGGGAVYQDEGNICFSFITNKSNRKSYELFLEPIIKFLESLGLVAEFKGKNDLTANGYKVSGNAQYISKERMYHHGTLLYNANLTVLGNALNVDKLKLESKGIKSARQRVINIIELLDVKLTNEEFTNKIYEYFKVSMKAKELNLSSYDTSELATYKKTEEWNYLKNPEFNVKSKKRFPGGTIEVFMNVVGNKIKDIKLWGDFLSNTDIENLYHLFIGETFINDKITLIVSSIENFEDYFGKIRKEELVELILGE